MYFKYLEKEGLLFTTGTLFEEKEKAQNDKSVFGKILFIDFESKNYKVFSKGHRNPQGLTVNNNIIISTEHGPRGGDEINLRGWGGQNFLLSPSPPVGHCAMVMANAPFLPIF